MAGRILMRTRTAAQFGAITTGLVLLPKGTVYAEDRDAVALNGRKPIYDDYTSLESAPSASDESSRPRRTGPTPTDRLTTQIQHARLLLHKYAAKTEDAANNALTTTFNAEKNFTSTVASLAPSRETGEQLMPGLIYTLVSAMGTSIVTRNRNILLRFSAPLAVGIGAGWYFIPVTMRNVGDLAWKYEAKYPVVADTHLRVKERVSRFIETGLAHTKMGVGQAEDKIGELRERAEEWVSKGK